VRVLVTGASGFLGKKVAKTLKREGHEVIGTYFSKSFLDNTYVDHTVKLDLEQSPLIHRILSEINPDAIVHTAAMTDVNLCEKKKDRALLINSTSVAHIANWCREHQSKLIHVSTDYVFDGSSGPYFEDSKPSPINFYGLTKYLAEILIENLSENYVIIRPTILYGCNDKHDKLTLPVKVIKKLGAGKRITVDNFRIKYPTLIDDVASGILKLIESDLRGIVHFSNAEPLTRYEWALTVADVFNLPIGLISGAPLDKNVFPPRPVDVKLMNRNLKASFRFAKEGLSLMKQQMEE
jgi:dTDP-4-dehydrorhamnose reductase